MERDAITAMDGQVIRLECLKLAHRHDRETAQVVDVAKAYETYVVGQEKAKAETATKKTLTLDKPTTPKDPFK